MTRSMLLIITTGLISCASGNSAAIPIKIDETDNNAVVNASTGQMIILSLRGNPTTEIDWFLQDVNSDVLSLVDDDFQSDRSDPGMVGVGGTYIYEFRAEKKGDAQINLIYKRQGSDGEVFDEFSVNIHVTE